MLNDAPHTIEEDSSFESKEKTQNRKQAVCAERNHIELMLVS